MPHLIQWMKRPPSSGSSGKRKPRADPKDEPNFYDIGAMYPIPDYYDENGGVPFYGPVREESYPPRDADKRYGEEGLGHDMHMHQYHYTPWDYPVEGHTDYYYPSPKRLRSNSAGHHHGIQHDMSFDDSWNQVPHRTVQHPPNELHFQNYDHYQNYSESFAKEPAPTDVTKHTSPSKNHWHSFCEALSHSEDEENKQVTNENEGPLSSVVESIDFEPHSLYDFTPVTDFRKNSNVAPGPYHNECHDHHPAQSYNHEYYGGHHTPPRMPKIEELPDSLTRNTGGRSRMES